MRRVLTSLFVFCLALGTLLGMSTTASAAPSSAPLYPRTPVFSANFRSGNMKPFVPNNGFQNGGNWAIKNGALVATDLGKPKNLSHQIAGVPHMLKDAVLKTTFTIGKLDPNAYYRIGLFGRGSAPGTGDSQWDMVLDAKQLQFIDQNVNHPARIPFTVSVGKTYNMVMVIDGNWVGGKIWVAGTAEPRNWTISAQFKSSGDFTTVGVAAGNADVSFHSFTVFKAPPSLSVTSSQSGAIFSNHALPTYTLDVNSNSPDEVGNYYVNYKVTALDGSTVLEGQEPVELTATGSFEKQIVLPIHQYGYYNTSFSLTNQRSLDGQSGTPTQRMPEAVEVSPGSMAIVPPPNNLNVSVPSSPFGINGPGASTNVINANRQAQLLQTDRLFKEQGIQWVRTELRWNFVEPHPGTYTWSHADGLVAAGHDAHVNLLGLLDYWGNYANPFKKGSTVSFNTAVKEYDQYVQAVVKRYMPGGTLAKQLGWKNYGITAWEVWNEPSTRAFWLSRNPEQYAELVQSASAAIKAVEPQATILAYGWQRDTLFQVAGTHSFTGISIHNYPGPIAPPQQKFFHSVTDWRAFLAQKGMPKAPLWITESGWSTKSVTSTQQAQYLAQAEIQTLAAGVNKFFMFSWYFPATIPGGGYGELTGSPGRLMPKPGYAALAALTSRLHGYKGVASLNPLKIATATQAYTFQNGSSSLVAIWANNSNGTLSLNNPGNLKAYDWMGNQIPVRNGHLSVPLNGSPVYIVSHEQAKVLAQRVAHGTITGIPPVSVKISSLSSSPVTLPHIHLTVTNQINVPLTGKLTLHLPQGWQATGGNGTTSNAPSVTFSALSPGQSLSPSFQMTRFEANTSNQYNIQATAVVNANSSTQAQKPSSRTSTNSLTTTVSNTLPVSVFETVYDQPANGSFPDWKNASPIYLDRTSQNVGIPNWNPSVESAKAYTMWGPKDFYFAVHVTDKLFNEPYTGFNQWKGDSVQLFWDPQNSKTSTFDQSAGDANLGLAKTPAGNQAFRWQGSGYGLHPEVKLQITPGSTAGDMWYQAAIPWSDLTDFTVQSGHKYGFDFLVNDNNGSGRLGWIWLAPGIGNGFNPSLFPTFTLVKGAGLAALRLDSTSSSSTVPFTANQQGTVLNVTNDGLSKITISLSNGNLLTLIAEGAAQRNVTPTGNNATVSVLANGTTSINLQNYVSSGNSISLTASSTPSTSQSAVLQLRRGTAQ